MLSHFLTFYSLHSQEADGWRSTESSHGPISQLLPVEVSTASIPSPTTHEGDQLLSIAGRVKLYQFTVGGLHLLPTDGREETDSLRVDGCLLGSYDVLVDGVEAVDTFDQFVGYGDVIAVPCECVKCV